MNNEAKYHLQSFRACKFREELGGVKAVDSDLFKRSVSGLDDLGWSKARILESVKTILLVDHSDEAINNVLECNKTLQPKRNETLHKS